MDLTPGPAEDQERSDGFRRWTPELEPRIWSHITDALPDGHPLAQEVVACVTCNDMVHASNNECMSTWVETGRGAYCIACFVDAIKEVQPALKEILPNGTTFTFSEQTFHLLEEGEGWGLTSDPMREAAYRAGREDAARDLEAKIVPGARAPFQAGEIPSAKRVREWAAAVARGEHNTARGSE